MAASSLGHVKRGRPSEVASEVFQCVPKACWGAVLGSDVSSQERQAAVPGNEGLFALHFRHSPQACWAGNSLVISAGKKTVWTQERIISFDFKEIAKD